jgi:Zn-finger nucleic acid-binding protein
VGADGFRTNAAARVDEDGRASHMLAIALRRLRGGFAMKCPVDNIDLVMSERQGIEIDYCPKCRGVWLDRGELDKIIERANTAAPQSAPQPAPQQPGYHGGPTAAPYPPPYQQPYKHKRRKSFLEELFD